MGKLTPAHSAGAHTARGLCVAPGRWVGAELTAAGPPTAQGTPTVHGLWEALRCGQGLISLEYQTCTSTYPFDTLVTGMGGFSFVTWVVPFSLVAKLATLKWLQVEFNPELHKVSDMADRYICVNFLVVWGKISESNIRAFDIG